MLAPAMIEQALAKSVSQSEVNVGAQVTFTVTVANEGLAGATGVTVSDALPSGLTYVSDNGNGGFDPTSGVWTVGSLAAGASTSLDLVVTVDQVGTFTNVAQVATANEPDADSTPGNCNPAVIAEDDCNDATVTATQVLSTCALGDFVWLDANGNGKQDAGEKGIARVAVTITNITPSNAGQPKVVPPGLSDSVKTDANGRYLFAALEAGTYRVVVDTKSVANNLALTTVSTYTVTLDGIGTCQFLDADFGFAETLPKTGMDNGVTGLIGITLVMAGGLLLQVASRLEEGKGCGCWHQR